MTGLQQPACSCTWWLLYSQLHVMIYSQLHVGVGLQPAALDGLQPAARGGWFTGSCSCFIAREKCFSMTRRSEVYKQLKDGAGSRLFILAASQIWRNTRANLSSSFLFLIFQSGPHFFSLSIHTQDGFLVLSLALLRMCCRK